MSPTTRSSTKRSREDAAPTTNAASTAAEEPPAKVQKVSEASGLKGDNVPASPASKEDVVAYQKRTMHSPGYNLRSRRRMANTVRPAWTGMPASAQQGMRNLTGVLCYRSALLQSLLHQPQFCAWLNDYHEPQHCIWTAEGRPPCVACALRNLAQAYWSGKSVDAAYVAVNECFKANKWQNGGGGQQDPDDQLTWIVKKFSEQLPSSHFAVFSALCQFILDGSTTCTACGHVSSVPGDIEGSLAIDLLPRIKGGNLAVYVQKYLSYNVEGYRCDYCRDNEAEKQRSREIAHSPDFFALQLKRFDWLGNKDSYPIPITPHLDLNANRTPNNKANSEYELSSVVLHRGSSKAGHYVCLSRGPDGQWLRFDDKSVSRVSEASVLASADKKSYFTPYLLFYQRVR